MEWKLDTGLFAGCAELPATPSQDWHQGHGTLQPKECNSTSIKSSTTSHPPMGASEYSYFSSTNDGGSHLYVPPAAIALLLSLWALIQELSLGKFSSKSLF